MTVASAGGNGYGHAVMRFSGLGKEFDAQVTVDLAVPTAETRPAPFAQRIGWIQAIGQETVYPAATLLLAIPPSGPGPEARSTW